MHNNEEITRYGFISHMEDYMRQLLKNPMSAKPDEYLQKHGINSEKALKMLLEPTEKDNPESSVMTRKERIISNKDENGKAMKDTFSIQYKLPRKDYNRKLRNLYINMFENHIVKGGILDEEGAASCGSVMQSGAGNLFSDGGNPNAGQYDTPIAKPISKDIYKPKSGKKNIYITNEQSDYLKDILNEDCPAEMGSMFGNFGYDASGPHKKNDPTLDHKNMCVDKNLMKGVVGYGK